MAKWICHPGDNRLTKLVPVFRRRFEVHKDLEKAALRLTAHGVYEAELNGVSVTENKFMPGLTSYYYRIQVQEYDVTALLREGGNELRVTVGDGWWRWNNNFGYTLALWGELRILYADGSVETLSKLGSRSRPHPADGSAKGRKLRCPRGAPRLAKSRPLHRAYRGRADRKPERPRAGKGALSGQAHARRRGAARH